MLTLIKKHLPQPIKRALAATYQHTIAQWKKRRLFLRMQKKHQALLAQIKGKERIRVVFLAIHKSVWKVDPVFQKMLADPFFDPIILVCPYTAYGEERMWEDMRECLAYFNEKDYPTHSSYNLAEQRWIKLKELTPDIVFFTNPHNLTRKEYYEDAYLNYLSCYVPYHHEVGSYEGNVGQYNQDFHNAAWLIFASHNASYKLFEMTAQSKAENVRVTGYPAMEELLKIRDKKIQKKVWKNDDSRLKAIWAPHHTINDPVLPYSNFIEYAYKFKELAEEYKNKIIWCFKPHPILKSKLYNHPDWGREKTDEFYLFWERSEFSQISEGEYFDLFAASDFMIHDSGSFLAEYLYLEKPVMYLLSGADNEKYYSDFGVEALKSCDVGYKFSDVIGFIDQMISGRRFIKREHVEFMNKEINPYFSQLPSDKIIDAILRGFK